MLLPLKHIIRLLLFVFLIGNFVACQSWREAKAVVKEADSLLVEHKVVTRDTAALLSAIHTLDGVLGRVFAREYLAKAYYFMGRNFYYLNDFSTAADYYILCDRTNPSDPMYKGRINSCMGYLCKQDSCFEEALVFYERSSKAFHESGNDWYYAHNLLNVAEQYVNLREYDKADSVLAIAERYEIDSAYYARMIDVKALAFFNQQMYDSVRIYLSSIKDYPRNIFAKCYSCMKLMQAYLHLNEYALADDCAYFIINNTHLPNYRTNAYYALLKYAEIKHDVERLAQYSYLRKDEDRNVRHRAESYAEASQKLKTYLVNPYPYKRITCYIIIISVLGCSLGVLAFWLYKRYNQTLQIHADTLQIHEQQRAERCKVFANRVYNHSICFLDVKLWDKNDELRKLANTHISDIFTRLEDTYRFSDQEIKICLMILLEYTREQMATILRIQPNTISKTKNKIAKSLNTTSSQLRDFLIDFLAI